MNIKKILLTGSCSSEIDIELRYHIASARIDNVELIIFLLDRKEDGSHAKRITFITRLLNKLRREGSIKYFVTPKAIEHSSTEAQFLINKFEALTMEDDGDRIRIYASI